jgi:hypothetical protein
LGLTRDQESGAQPTPKAGNSPSKDQKPGAANNAGAGADAGSGPADQFRKLLEQLQSLGPNGIKQVLQQNPQLATTLLRAT